MSNEKPQFEAKKTALIARLKRVEGQLRGIQTMMREEEDCERVAQQLSAARGALDRAFFESMRCAMEQELLDDRADSAQLQDRLGRITALIAKYG